MDHNEAVFRFFEECRKSDPDRYIEVCNRHPVISKRKIIQIRQREQTVGLLGLQPSSIPIELSSRYDAIVKDDD